MSYPNERDCEHGLLRGRCDRCDDAEEIARLRQQVEGLEREIERLKAEVCLAERIEYEALKRLETAESSMRKPGAELEQRLAAQPVAGEPKVSNDILLEAAVDAWQSQTSMEWSSDGLQAAVDAVHTLLTAPPAQARPIDWRAHSAQFARGESPPQNLETAQAAWARDQELIFEQRDTIAKQSQTINQLRQARPVVPEWQPMPFLQCYRDLAHEARYVIFGATTWDVENDEPDPQWFVAHWDSRLECFWRCYDGEGVDMNNPREIFVIAEALPAAPAAQEREKPE